MTRGQINAQKARDEFKARTGHAAGSNEGAKVDSQHAAVRANMAANGGKFKTTIGGGQASPRGGTQSYLGRNKS